MGFSNGYDAGYDDAKAELMPKIKALEAQVASGASSSISYSPGPRPGGGTAPGPVAVQPPVPFGIFSVDYGSENLLLDLTMERDVWLVGSAIEDFNPANGDSVTMSSAADDSDAVDLVAEGLVILLASADSSERHIPEGVLRVLTGGAHALQLGCGSAGWAMYGLSQLNDSSNAKLNITINGTTVSYKLIHHS